MVTALRPLAEQYRKQNANPGPVYHAVHELYERFVKERERSLLDAVAVAGSVNALFLSDRVDFSKVTPEMAEAFHLAYPSIELSSLANHSPAELEGFLSGWKGKYFEVLVRDKLNAGEWVGDVHLNYGQKAVLAESTTQQGWDLRIIDADGSVADELQLKATESLAYVREALERHPHIDIITTDEVLSTGDDFESGVTSSGFSDAKLEETLQGPVEALLDTTIEELAEALLSASPFVIIALSEGRAVILGHKSLDRAVRDGCYRATKSGAAIGVGALVACLDGGLLSVPAAFLTRIGFDRYTIANRAGATLDRRTTDLRSLKQHYCL